MDTPPAPPKPPGHKPSAKGMGQALKDPKVLAAVAIVGILMSLYFRSRQNANKNLPASDGTGTPQGDYVDPTGYYPDQTQGASSGGGSYGGYDSPTMNTPDWLAHPPDWVLTAPSWWGTEPPASNSSNPAANPSSVMPRDPIALDAGQAIYDPETHQVYTSAPTMAPAAAVVTGGGPPTAVNHATPPKAAPPAAVIKAVTPAGKTINSNPVNEKRYVTNRRPQPGGKKDHIWHDYESAFGKGDWGKGGKVDMGPA